MLCSELDDLVGLFLKRPLTGQRTYLWLDATDLKVRDNGRVMSQAVVVAVGVTQDGRRKVLESTVEWLRHRLSGLSFSGPSFQGFVGC